MNLQTTNNEAKHIFVYYMILRTKGKYIPKQQ
jgi:hypothetical protein